MTKQDLIEEVGLVMEIPRQEVARVLDGILDSMARALCKGEEVKIGGFGSFGTRPRKARLGRNPRTGAPVQVPARKFPRFRPSKELKGLVNAGAWEAILGQPADQDVVADSRSNRSEAEPMVMVSSDRERRAYPRVNLHLRCALGSPARGRGPVVGVTENISRGGLLMRWEPEPAVVPLPLPNDVMPMMVEWPGRGPGEQRYLWCCGRVIRLSAAWTDRRPLIAVEIKRLVFPSPRTRKALLSEREPLAADLRQPQTILEMTRRSAPRYAG